MYQAITLSAGVAVEFSESATFFRLMEAAPADLQIIFYRDGREVSRAESIAEGYAESFVTAIDRVRITSATGGAIEFVMRVDSTVLYDKPPTGNISGSVSISNVNGAFTQAAATVTNASAQLLAAKANRRYLMVQNNDTSGIVYVTLDGTAATTGKGVKLIPGASLELSTFTPTGQVNAIGSIASNANVVVVEG